MNRHRSGWWRRSGQPSGHPPGPLDPSACRALDRSTLETMGGGQGAPRRTERVRRDTGSCGRARGAGRRCSCAGDAQCGRRARRWRRSEGDRSRAWLDARVGQAGRPRSPGRDRSRGRPPSSRGRLRREGPQLVASARTDGRRGFPGGSTAGAGRRSWLVATDSTVRPSCFPSRETTRDAR